LAVTNQSVLIVLHPDPVAPTQPGRFFFGLRPGRRDQLVLSVWLSPRFTPWMNRTSMALQENAFILMDCRVKPGNDES
jgi:hypothetical protein